MPNMVFRNNIPWCGYMDVIINNTLGNDVNMYIICKNI